MSQKIKLIMLVCGADLTFNIDGTNDTVIFALESQESTAIEEYLRWSKHIVESVDFPNGDIGKWDKITDGANTLYKELQDILDYKYTLELIIPKDDFSDVHK